MDQSESRASPPPTVAVDEDSPQLASPAPASPLLPTNPPPAYPTHDNGPYIEIDLGIQQSTSLGHPFRVREQIWDRLRADWVPYFAQPAPNFGGALFVINHRRYSRDDDEEVTVVVDVLDASLVESLRDICHNLSDVYNTKPSIDLKLIYPHLEALTEYAAELHSQEQNAPPTLGEGLTPSDALKSFVEVVDREFTPHREKVERLLSENMITFEFLWKVFKVGQKIRDTHSAFRDMTGATLEDIRSDTGNVVLSGNTLTWNGSQYEYVSWMYGIKCFSGPRALKDLGVTVMTDKELSTLTERGRRYVQFTGIHHVEISGQIVNLTREYSTLDGGRVILDTKAFKQARGDRDMQIPQYVPSPVYVPQANAWGAPDPAAYGPGQGPPRRRKHDKAPTINLPMDSMPEDMLWLLPPTLGAYSIAEQIWGEVRVMDIHPVIYDETAWDRLVLDPDTKTLIRSLVHVRVRPATNMLADWIKGKGGGLVVLLHGVSGVGKTFTAEAVAELLHRPLYAIGSAELGSGGMYGNGMEPALKAALKRATEWNAVLLIDEADVWLEKRSDTDLWRNSEVATFLRSLEYHSGVVFLTTNRVKSFDEAFLSRISVAIKYPDLELSQRSKIWEQLLRHVMKISGPPKKDREQPGDDMNILSDDNIKQLAVKPFNGRIIKNIVRTAQALAVSSDEPLSMRHLNIVVSVTEKFLQDTQDVRNNDERRAWWNTSSLLEPLHDLWGAIIIGFVACVMSYLFARNGGS
ncbi:P-loop containing nucleoside triphosphate hydrolase protein [Exidia glandulosa HHB12029]|uniref:p-loop containing nucleoside triphosphate hydrolase protein n=1 Tax=Exidia glandulosa HHB12029 TaxID=1314781 RepID=A0A165KBF8_EXIGL|nr:P-loop containing nucleoside triphosphate hydrolase protein [Exidia glandulosa HHB12029]